MSAIRRAARIAVVVVVAAYPIGVWAAVSLAGGRAAGAVVLIGVLAMFAARMRDRRAPHYAVIVGSGVALSVVVALGIVLDDQRFLLVTPVLVNAALLAGFGASLLPGNTPMVEQFARAIERELPPEKIRYCRAVTRVWCVFFLANGLACLWLALFASVRIWALYAGGIAYAIMGALFAGEYTVRKIRFG